MSQIDLGAFSLLEPLGAGGMGVVWRGVHREQQVPVAIKVISALHAETQHFIEGFEREVQAVAGLHHPGVCRVFDHGHITAKAAAASEQRLKQGSPWLAMELATRGSLEEGLRPTSWKELRALLLSVIDALAHAHARGIVHRDIKPGNILITSSLSSMASDAADAPSRYLLTDFGLAHATQPTSERSQSEINNSTAGTPYYMPPEQLQGYWRDYGPWTDLYALGCVAYELACGRPPFVEDNLIRLAARHLNDPPPPLAPQFAVPRDLDIWIQTMLRKDWRERFQQASDAASALHRLGDEMLEPSRTVVFNPKGTLPENSSIFFAPTLTTIEDLEEVGKDTPDKLGESKSSSNPGDTVLLPKSDLEMLGQDDREHLLATRSLKLAPGQLLPMPKTWRYRDNHEQSLDLVGAGLGLFGLRAVPFVDREQARDRLWDELRRCRREKRPRTLHVRGATGTGKSRLVEWMGMRAQEVGAAQIIRVTHSAVMESEDGIEAALARFARCRGLERGKIYERVLEHLERAEQPFANPRMIAAALTELLDPSQGKLPVTEGGPVVKFSRASERHNILAQWLEVIAAERPVILWIEDAQWASDTLALLKNYLDRRDETTPCPAGRVLAVLTSRDDDEGVCQSFTETIESGEVLLEPLTPKDHLQFIHELLGLEPELEQKLAERTQGNPLFAVQIVSDWVERDQLEVGARGFRLRPGSDLSLPVGVLALWRERLAQLDTLGVGDWRLPLEIAAAMGQRFPRRMWEVASKELGAEIDPALLDALFSRAMLVREPNGTICWKHRLLRETVQQQSETQDRWKPINLGIALLIEESGGYSPRMLERKAYHLIEAGEKHRALEALLEASYAYVDQSQYSTAIEVHAKHTALCDALGLAEDAFERIKALPERADLARHQGNMAESKAFGERAWRATEHATGREALMIHAHASRGLGVVNWLAGNLDVAEEHVETALALYEKLGEGVGRLRTLHTKAWLMLRKNQQKEAVEAFEEGDRIGERMGEKTHRAWCIHGLAEVSVRAGKTGRGVKLGRQARILFEESGAMAGVAFSQVCIGDALRLGGNPVSAEPHYAGAHDVLSALGSVLTHVNTFKRGMNFAMLRDWEGVERQLIQLEAQPNLVPRTRDDTEMLRGCLASHEGDAERFTTVLGRALEGLLNETDAHPDQVVLLRLAHENWLKHGRPDLAAVCASSIKRVTDQLRQPELDFTAPIETGVSIWSKPTPAG